MNVSIIRSVSYRSDLCVTMHYYYIPAATGLNKHVKREVKRNVACRKPMANVKNQKWKVQHKKSEMIRNAAFTRRGHHIVVVPLSHAAFDLSGLINYILRRNKTYHTLPYQATCDNKILMPSASLSFSTRKMQTTGKDSWKVAGHCAHFFMTSG